MNNNTISKNIVISSFYLAIQQTSKYWAITFVLGSVYLSKVFVSLIKAIKAKAHYFINGVVLLWGDEIQIDTNPKAYKVKYLCFAASSPNLSQQFNNGKVTQHY